MGKSLTIIKTLATHKATYRFLFVLGSAFGVTSGLQHIDQLEALLCALLGGCY